MKLSDRLSFEAKRDLQLARAKAAPGRVIDPRREEMRDIEQAFLRFEAERKAK